MQIFIDNNLPKGLSGNVAHAAALYFDMNVMSKFPFS